MICRLQAQGIRKGVVWGVWVEIESKLRSSHGIRGDPQAQDFNASEPLRLQEFWMLAQRGLCSVLWPATPGPFATTWPNQNGHFAQPVLLPAPNHKKQ